MSDETREDENAILRVGLDKHEEAVGEDTGEEDTGAVGGGKTLSPSPALRQVPLTSHWHHSRGTNGTKEGTVTRNYKNKNEIENLNSRGGNERCSGNMKRCIRRCNASVTNKTVKSDDVGRNMN